MKNFLLNLQFIFRPNYWFMNYPCNKRWDKILNKLLDEYEFEPKPNEHYSCNLGGFNLWVENYPYACFVPYEAFSYTRYRASRLTILRAQKAYKKALRELHYDKYNDQFSRYEQQLKNNA